ncbi:SWIM zinc finger family protein [Eionea flava]
MITDKQLIALAGKGAFTRGKDYFASDAVIEWNKKGTKINGLVEGSQTYTVTLHHTTTHFDGSCDCPASEGIDFCKHCVAVALAYRQEQTEQKQLESGKPLQRIEAYLNKLDKPHLQDELIALIKNDRVLREQWSLRADLALNKIDAKAIKKRITAALPYNRHYYRYPQVRSYFAQAEPTIELLVQQAPNLEVDKALALVDYSLQRLEKAL